MAVTQGELITALTTFLSTNPVRLAMRSGLASELDLADLIVGEIALATDTLQVWICTSLGTVIPLTGLTILGYYANAGALAAAHPTGTAGQIYLVGSAPSHTYTWGGAAWVDLGAFNDVSVFATLADPTFTGTVTLPSTTSIGNVSAAEIAVLNGLTSTTAELNILDGVTATTAELNYVDGVTSAIQTQINAKMNLAGGSGNPFTAMPYVGASPIVESGTGYVKWADGTMICYAKSTELTTSNAIGAVFYSGYYTWTFPVAFYAAPLVVASVSVSSGIAFGVRCGQTDTDSIDNTLIVGSTATDRGYVSFMAIGRWKA